MKKVKFDFDATKRNIFVNQNAAVPVGAPVDQIGAVANNGNAIGIVIGAKKQVISGRFVKNLVVMVAGYCDIIDAQEIWGDEYSAEAIAAMSDIIFCDDHKIGGGGGWPADLPKPSVGGYGYTEQGEQTVITWDGDTEGKVVYDDTFFKVSDLTPSKDSMSDAKIVFNGVEYDFNAVDIRGVNGYYDTNGLVSVFLDDSETPKGIYFAGGDEDEYVSSLTYGTPETVHKIDEKYLPQSGGAMVVNFTVGEGNITADKTPAEVLEMMKTSVVIGNATGIVGNIPLGYAVIDSELSPAFCFIEVDENRQAKYFVCAIDGNWVVNFL